MKTCLTFLAIASLSVQLGLSPAFAEDKPTEKVVRKITPGQVIVPFERMRRIWGELLTVDLETRKGTFRAEHNDEVFHFTAMPYAEMLHHATFGDLSDFRLGERAIFRMHENEAGEWVWLTYIQDEMNMLNGHGEYYFVDAIDADKRSLDFTWAKGDKTFVRETGLTLQTDNGTQFWKAGKLAKFEDIKVGDKLRAKTHGTGKGRGRIAWHVFFDDESLLKFQAEQMDAHAKKMAADGLPGYVDAVTDEALELTLFQEAKVVAEELKPGQKIRVAPAEVSRKAHGEPISGQVISCQRTGKIYKLKLTANTRPEGFEITGLARVWVNGE
jgi:hypothetical protein